MSNFIEDMKITITEYLQNYRDYGIKRSLSLLDVAEVDSDMKKKIRKSIIDGYNEFYLGVCRVLTYIQEKDEEANKK